uniref:Uncharacterized protein n=1 Tax=Caenorhabditis japonica TaxID=281687 RepID=A0A8R1DXA5_CAEJA
MNLELDLNDHLRIELVKILEEDDVQQKNQKKQTELLVQLVDKKAHKATILAKKTLRWPIGQALPTQLRYQNVEEQLLVQGPTSEALVPLPKSKIDSLTATSIAKSGTSSKSKTFDSFAVNPKQTFDIRSLSKSIQNVIETPEKEKKWKNLTKSLDELKSGEAIGALSAIEQAQFLEAIQKYVGDADSEPEHVDALLRAVCAAKILNFRAEDQFLRLCVEKEKREIVEIVLNDSTRVVSEFILAELLKSAAAKPIEERRSTITSVLSRNFSKPAMMEACSAVLSAADSVEVMTVLTEIYKEPVEESIDISGKALSLITVLMDAHGSRIVCEDRLHQKFAAISNFIIEMQSLVGTFARLEAAIDECADDFPQYNVVYRITPTVHSFSWQ